MGALYRLTGQRAQLLHAFAAVGHVGSVAEIQYVLARQEGAQHPHGGEPADAGVEYADRS